MAKTAENPYISTRLDLMSLNLTVLSYTFIIPSKNIRSSFWKSKLYRLMQMLSYIVYIAVFILEAVGLYTYWGNLIYTVENIAIASTLLIGYVPAIFARLNEKNILEVIEKLETQSLLCLKSVRRNERHMKIINEAKKFSTYFLTFTFICLIFTIMFWSFSPLFMYVWDRQYEKNTDPETIKGKFEYLVYIMYMPYNVNDPLVYFIVYFIQALPITSALTYILGYVTLYINLFIYLIVQFKIVSDALDQIDDLNDEIDYTSLTKMNIKRDGTWDINILISDERLEKNNMVECYITGSGTEKVEDPAAVLLVECVKLHQFAIEFAEKVNDVAGKGLFVASLCVTALLVTQTFQLSLIWTTKYFAGFLTSLTQLYIMSWFGQNIMEGNENVGIAAYNCRWYDRSTKYMRLMLPLQARSQYTLEMTLGNMFPLKLELFSEVVRTAYKFYTVLLEMQES